MAGASVYTWVVAVCILTVVAARPSTDEQNGRQMIIELPVETQTITLKPNKNSKPTENDNTRDIIEKIKQINGQLKKPNKKYDYGYQKYGFPTDTRGLGSTDQTKISQVKYTTDELLNKIREINQNLQIINNQKIARSLTSQTQISNDENASYTNIRKKKQWKRDDLNIPQMEQSNVLQYNSNYFTPSHLYLEDDEVNDIQDSNVLTMHDTLVIIPNFVAIPVRKNINMNQNRYLTRDPQIDNQKRIQYPPIPWPLAQYFPILIKDPVIALIHGGGLNNVIEYGQEADVCKFNSANKEINGAKRLTTNVTEHKPEKQRSRRKRSTKSSNVHKVLIDDDFNKKSNNKKSKKSTIATKKPQKIYALNPPDPIKENDYDGDLRFTEFGLFGNKRPVAPSPGFFINRLKVRKGGVAIAGPGGVATAGRGGTAIVGPGGLAYTQPGGLAIAGPSARVVALSSTADLDKIIEHLRNTHIQNHYANEESTPRRLEIVPEGKVVATGPVVYYHKSEDSVTPFT